MGHVNGVNSDSLAKLKAIIADGKVEANEILGLSETEKDALQKYLQGEGKDLPKEGEIVYIKDYKPAVDTRSNFAILVDSFKEALPKALAALLALTPLGMQSCDKVDQSTIVEQSDITQNVEFNLTVEQKKAIDDLCNMMIELLKLIAKGQEADRKDNEEINKQLQSINDAITKMTKELGLKLDTIINELVKRGLNLDEILQVLLDMGKDLSVVCEALVDMGKDVSQIVVSLESLGKTTKEIYEALKASGAQLTDILIAVQGNTEYLKEISGNNDKILAQVTKIANLGEQIKGEYKEVLNNILAKIGDISSKENGSADLAKVEGLLADILAKMEVQIKNQEKMSQADKDFYELVASKLDKMSEDQLEFFNTYLELDAANKAKAGELLAAINKNTEVAKGTYTVANMIFESMGTLGDKADNVINVLKNLAVVGDCKFNPEDMKAFIKATVDGMMAKFKAQHKEALDNGNANAKAVLAKLQEILDKMPTGCKCDNSQILVLLEKIIENMEKPTVDDTTHEGIIGDLGDLFG